MKTLAMCYLGLLVVVLDINKTGAAAPEAEAATQALIKQLKDKDEFVRLKAAKALGGLGAKAKDAIPALTDALKDADADVRSVAKQALDKINVAADVAKRAEVLASLDKYVNAAKEKDALVRRKAALGLASLLSDSDEIIRLKAAQALGEMGIDAAPAVASLKEAATDNDAAVRKMARRTLEKIEEAEKTQKEAKIREALVPLLKELKSPTPEVRIRAIEKIVALGPDAKLAGESLVEAMLDRLPAVRNAASEALEKVEPSIQPHVFKLLYGEDKGGAITALKKMGADARHALPALIAFHQATIRQNPFDYLDYPIKVMTQIAPGDSRVARIVLNEIATRDPMFGREGPHPRRKAAIKLLDAIEATNKDKVTALVLALQDGDLAVEVIETLATIGKDAAPAIPILKKLKFATNDAIRTAAVKALAKIE